MCKVKKAAANSILLLLIALIFFLFVPHHRETSDCDELIYFYGLETRQCLFQSLSPHRLRRFLSENNQFSVNHFCCIDETHSHEEGRVFSFYNE